MVRDFFMEENKMTEETTNENAMAQQPNTETEPAKEITMKTYYWSNDNVPFRVIRTTDEITEDQYPIAVTAPDPNIKAPKYDWIEHKWIETSEESLGQRLTSVVEKLEDAQKSIDVLQEDHQKTLQNAESTDTAMDQLQKTVQMSNRMMATLSATVLALTKAYQGLKPSDTTTETKGDAQ